MNKNYCITSAIVFAFVALMHAWRFVLDLPMQIGGWYVPRSVSGFGALFAAALAIWAYRSARIDQAPKVAYT